jgi:hypothetical protein
MSESSPKMSQARGGVPVAGACGVSTGFIGELTEVSMGILL